MTKQLSQRIFQRVDEMGLDSALSSLSGLSPTRLDAIRHGGPLSSSEFEALCRAVAVDSGAMYAGSESNAARSPARFRAATALESPSPLDVRALALAAEQGRILGQLMELLGEPIRLEPHRHVVGPEKGLEIWQDGYQRGESARAALVGSDEPLLDLPRLLNELGIHLTRVPLSSESIDAASIWERGAVPVLLINETSHIVEHPGALRASLAHELCHLLHDAGERDLTTHVSWGARETGNYHEALEVRARAFAPAFLAPRVAVRKWHENLSERCKDDLSRMVQAMAEYWGLSFEGAAWHAKNCGLIAPEQAEGLAGLARKPLLALQEFESPEPRDQPAMVRHLPEKVAPLWQGWACRVVLKAVEEGVISVGRAREILTWS